MNSLNAQQLAFLLDIKKEDARARMCNAWEKAHDIPKNHIGELKVKREYLYKTASTKKLKDPYPNDMPIEMLATGLNLPTLQQMVDDIRENYLKRKGTKKWILCDFPEKVLKKCADDGKPLKVNLNPALESLLPDETVAAIKREWASRFPLAIVV